MLVKRKRRKGPGQKGLITTPPFLMPSLIDLLVFSLLPLLISAFVSLVDWDGLDQLIALGFSQEHFIGLDNYKVIFSNPEFWGTLWSTFRYIIMYAPLMLVAFLGVTYLLSRQHPGMTVFRIIYYTPMLTSWVAASMIWKSMLSPRCGAVNNILAIFDIQRPGWLLNEVWAMSAIVLMSVWEDMRFFGLVLLSGVVGINKSYYEAASLDGAGPQQKFWKITLPLMTPAIFYVLIISLINAFQLFPQIMVMTNGDPGGTTQVMVEYIYRYGFHYYRMDYTATFFWTLFVVIVVCTAIQMKGQER